MITLWSTAVEFGNSAYELSRLRKDAFIRSTPSTKHISFLSSVGSLSWSKERPFLKQEKVDHVTLQLLGLISINYFVFL